MRLSELEGQCVRIVDNSGDVFEGICTHNNADYNEHEFGRHEEGLELLNFQFFKSDIREVTCLEDHQGPYGKFSAPYGKLEELTVEEGIDNIEDVLLYSEEHEHVYRLLLCLEDHLDPKNGFHFEHTKEVVVILKSFLQMDMDAPIKEEAQKLINLWG